MNVPNLEIVRSVMRETAVDAMPELAEQLHDDPTVVQRHLLRELGLTVTARECALINGWPLGGPAGSLVSELQPTEQEMHNAHTLIKYERYTLVQSGTRRQANILLGEDRPEDAREAHFIEDKLQIGADRSVNGYVRDYDAMFNDAIEETYTRYPWLDHVNERYRSLYVPFSQMRPRPHTQVELPSIVLAAALNGAAARDYTVESSEFLQKHRDTWHLSQQARTEAAHDLAYLGLAFASQHFETVAETSIINLRGTIRQLPTKQWVYIRGSKKQDPTYHTITQRQNLYAPTLKCPVHQPTKAEPTTDLEYYLHASITAAKNYELFR